MSSSQLNAVSKGVIQKFLDKYLKTTVKAPEPEIDIEKVDNNVKIVEEKKAEEYCVFGGCKKRAKFGCAHKMCFNCCFNTCKDQPDKAACDFHHQSVLRREEEDRLILEGMSTLKSRQKTKFYHFEEKFMNYGQTVVIWCMQDFIDNPEWSADTFALGQRKGSRQNLLQKLRRLGDDQDISALGFENGTDNKSRKRYGYFSADAVNSAHNQANITHEINRWKSTEQSNRKGKKPSISYRDIVSESIGSEVENRGPNEFFAATFNNPSDLNPLPVVVKSEDVSISMQQEKAVVSYHITEGKSVTITTADNKINETQQNDAVNGSTAPSSVSSSKETSTVPGKKKGPKPKGFIAQNETIVAESNETEVNKKKSNKRAFVSETHQSPVGVVDESLSTTVGTMETSTSPRSKRDRKPNSFYNDDISDVISSTTIKSPVKGALVKRGRTSSAAGKSRFVNKKQT